MRILGPVIDLPASDVPGLHAKITQSGVMRRQFVCHDNGWTEAL
jgi:hypothetical protein